MLALYHSYPSVCSHKARFCLAEKELDYEERPMDLGKGVQFEAAYLKLNPNAVVPTLVHDGKAVIESSVIIQYLDDVFPQKPLMPKDEHHKALIRIWLLRSVEFHASINTMSYATAFGERDRKNKTPEEREAGYAKIPSAFRAAKKRDLVENGMRSLHVEAAIDQLSGVMRDMDAGLAQWQWVVGDTLSLADIGLIAYVDRLEKLGMEGFWVGRYPRIADWFERMKSRKAYAESVGAGNVHLQPDITEIGSRAWPEIERRLPTG